MVKFPESMDELIYFTRRNIGENGKSIVWVYKQKCPECGKALMAKPKDEKTGKAMIRAKEYVCPECKYTAEKKAYEESLTAEMQYTCSSCGFKGDAETVFKRKKIQGIGTLRFQCGKCKANIDITKKMKEKGSRGGDDEE